jgi:thermostable 8-oxoguanine DNA glycosylase
LRYVDDTHMLRIMDAVKEIRIVDPHVVNLVNEVAAVRKSKAASKTASQLILERIATLPVDERQQPDADRQRTDAA